MPLLSREQIKFKVGKINFDRGKEVLLGRPVQDFTFSQTPANAHFLVFLFIYLFI
jgi:hypothetical protein